MLLWQGLYRLRNSMKFAAVTGDLPHVGWANWYKCYVSCMSFFSWCWFFRQNRQGVQYELALDRFCNFKKVYLRTWTFCIPRTNASQLMLTGARIDARKWRDPTLDSFQNQAHNECAQYGNVTYSHKPWRSRGHVQFWKIFKNERKENGHSFTELLAFRSANDQWCTWQNWSSSVGTTLCPISYPILLDALQNVNMWRS